MKKFLFFLFFAITANAQTHRFIYEMKFKPDSTKADYRTENMVLDVNPNEVKFYPYAVIRMDSMSKTGHPWTGFETELPYIIRKKTGYKNTSYFLNDALFKVETNDEIKWKLYPDTKKENGYLLQKATTKFGGRNWVAWFCKDVDIPEGPYKFKGLPGLIFAISDDRNNYSFKLLQNKNYPETYDTSAYVENFNGMKAILVTQNVLNAKLLEVYQDPVRDTRESFKNNINPENTFWYMGTQIKTLDQFKDLTKVAQARIRRENNPIELEKAIHYPEK